MDSFIFSLLSLNDNDDDVTNAAEDCLERLSSHSFDMKLLVGSRSPSTTAPKSRQHALEHKEKHATRITWQEEQEYARSCLSSLKEKSREEEVKR